MDDTTTKITYAVEKVTMSAGIEMDSLIGKHLFGWSEEKTEANDWHDPYANLWRPRPNDNGMTPSFSRNPADAFKVVAEVERRGTHMVIHGTPDPNQFTALVYGRYTCSDATGDFATAICLAALDFAGAL